MTHEEIDAKVRELDMLEAHIKDLEAQRDKIKSMLKAELDAVKEDVIDTGINRIWYTAYSKKSVDAAKLKEAGIYEMYAKESTVLQFRITKVTN